MVRFFVLLISITSFAHSHAQDINGRVVDATTNDPISFATIRIKKTSLGVVANADGDFRIPARLQSVGDTIVVSSIGYTTTSFSFNAFKGQALTVLKIKQAVTQLEAVIVDSRKRIRMKGEPTTSGIVTRAIRNIPNNYPQQPYSYLGYYRDYQVRDSAYINLNEAIVEVFDKGFSTNDQLQTDITLYEYKRNNDFVRDSSMEIPYDNKPNTYDKTKNKYIPNAFLYSYGGNELSILRLHDAIRNYDKQSYSFVNVFSKDFVLNHYLKREDDVWLDTVALYCISFESQYRASGPMHFSKGKIYIEKRNFAIHKLEYAVYNKTMRETLLMYDIKVEYARHGSGLYLNYISFNNFFKTQNDVDFKVIDFEYNPITNVFVVSFNAPPNPVDLIDINNYLIKQGNAPLTVKYIEKIEERKAAIFLDESARSLMRKQDEKSSSNLTYTINIRDINNRELDKHTVTAINQFRELFVEEVHTSESTHSNITFIRKDIPLAKNPSLSNVNSNYWMNPPLLKR
jgi:hypothetical protein